MTTATLDPEFVAAFRSGKLTEKQAIEFASLDKSVITFLLLQLSVAMTAAPQSGANTPSSTIPPYEKLPPTSKRKKKAGAKKGHKGSSRKRPQEIDRHQTHQAPNCPDCGGVLNRTGRTRQRVTEDIPENLKPEVTEHTIHRDWCPHCKKQVEPRLPDVLPHCTLGNRTLTLAAWLHYGVGTTASQIVDVFNHHLKIKLTSGGLHQMWHRLADVLTPWYVEIRDKCLHAGVLWADETGWRMNGDCWWMWCFSTQQEVYYWIDPSRGHAALEKFFVEEFDGILVSDFWEVYDMLSCAKQKCWPHLLRDMKAVDQGSQAGGDWPAFAKRLRRVFTDAVRLAAARGKMPEAEYESKKKGLQARVDALATEPWNNRHAQRLAKRLVKYGDDLLTFVEFEGVPSDNNHSERMVRCGVQMRKNSYGSRSEVGIYTRNVLMSIYKTLKLRGLDPLEATLQALKILAETGKLPSLPPPLESVSSSKV
jgi:transposase